MLAVVDPPRAVAWYNDPYALIARALEALEMPFYIRTRPRRPLWHPAVAGAGVMLLWGLAQAILLATSPHVTQPSPLRQGLVILALSIAGGAVAGALYWGLGLSHFLQSTPLRWATATAAVMAYLVALTLAASQAEPGGAWTRVGRPTFLLSTLLLSVVLGWLIAGDPFGLVASTERVYLTPAEFAALPQSAQERLRPDATSPPDPGDVTRAG